jgi:maltose O-acetyltransferase
VKEPTAFWRRWMKLRNLLIPSGPAGDRARGRLYEPFLKSFGRNFKVAEQAFIFNPNGLTVGDDVYIGFGSYLGQGEISLEDETLIGDYVSITASNHLRKDGSFRFGGYESKAIRVGRGTWVGAHASLTAGIAIGAGCLVAAGAVVNKSFPENVVLGGVPARTLKVIEDTKEQ